MSQTVLVADDSRVMRKIIIRAIKGLGVTDIYEASDGAEAIDAIRRGSFGIVVTDWNMPEKTGIDLLKFIRAEGSDVPVVLITTESDSARVQEALDAGVTDYLAKPFDDGKVREKLEKYVKALT